MDGYSWYFKYMDTSKIYEKAVGAQLMGYFNSIFSIGGGGGGGACTLIVSYLFQRKQRVKIGNVKANGVKKVKVCHKALY